MKRNKIIGFRLNSVDKNMLTAIAKQSGATNSQVIRALIMMAYSEMNTKGEKSVIPLLFADK
jgi:antitoxin component of RelBE/YafQ-DinJ toxin-antitoxin module